MNVYTNLGMVAGLFTIFMCDLLIKCAFERLNTVCVCVCVCVCAHMCVYIICVSLCECDLSTAHMLY